MNQKSFIPSGPGIFQFDIFLSVTLGKSVCIFTFWPSSTPSSSLVILFILSAISLCFLVPIFYPKIVGFLLHPVVGMFYCNLLLIVDIIFFHCFGMSYFVSIFNLCRYLFILILILIIYK